MLEVQKSGPSGKIERIEKSHDSSPKTRKVYVLGVAFVAVLLLGTSFGMMLSATTPSTPTVIEPGSMMASASYIVFKDSSTYYARNGSTGALTYSGANAGTILTSLISELSSGGMIYFRKGMYDINSLAITNNHIALISEEGTSFLGRIVIEGTSTATSSLLTANASNSGTTLTLTDASGFAVGDFIKISDTGADETAPGTGSSYAGHYEGNLVLSKAGNVLTLQTGINNNYLVAASALATKITPITDVLIQGGKLTNDVTRYSIYGYYVDRLTIRDLEVTPPSGGGTDGCYFACIQHSLLENLYVHGAHDAINLEISACHNDIVNVHCLNSEEDGIDLALFACYNKIVNPTLIGNNHNLAIEYSSSNNEVSGGIAAQADEAATTSYGVYILINSHHNNIHDMEIRDNNAHGVYIYSASNYNKVHDNRIHNNGKEAATTVRGVYISVSSLYNEVYGNEIYGNMEHGILVSQSSSYTRIYNNMVHDNGVAGGAHTQDGIVIAGTDAYCEIFGNEVWNHPRDEIRIHSADDTYVKIWNNILWGTHDAAMYINPTARTTAEIRDNSGWLTENSGVMPITGSVSTVTVTHSLAETPTIVVVTCNNTGAGDYSVTSITSTQFVITFTNQPATSTWAFYWYVKV